jgi:hypothetical protein
MKGSAGTPLNPIEEVNLWSNMAATQQRNGNQPGTQENRSADRGNLRAPYNNRFDRNWCGRPALCSVGL